MARSFPVNFSFKGFDTSVGRTIDRINTRFGALNRTVRTTNNRWALMQKRTEALRKSLTKVGSGLKNAGRTMSTFVTLPALAAGTAMVKVAADAEETANKFNEVFGQVDKAARAKAVTDLAKNFKLADSTAQEFLGTSGQIIQGLDLSQEASLKASKRLAELSQDVASFRNVQGGAAQVVHAFNSALVGERERLKTLGIVITEADVKAETLALAQKGQRFETIKQAKALATLSLIEKRTAQDQGDFARTQDSLTNKLRITSERIKGLAERFGKLLIPVALKVLAVFEKVLSFFEAMPDSVKTVVLIVGALAAALGPLLFIVGSFVTVLPGVITAFSALGAVFAFLTGPIGLVIAAVAALIAIGVAVVKNWEGVKQFFLALWDGPLVRFLRIVTGVDALIALGGLLIKAWEPVKTFFKAVFKGIMFVIDPVIQRIEFLLNIAKKAGGFVLGGVKKLLFGDKDPLAGFKGSDKREENKERALDATRARKIAEENAKQIRTVNDSRVRVDFNNMPRGTRVKAESSGISPDLNLGFAGGLQ